MTDKSCKQSCPLYRQEWPKNAPKTLCRLHLDHDRAENPVTKSVIRDIILNREEFDPDYTCHYEKEKSRKVSGLVSKVDTTKKSK